MSNESIWKRLTRLFRSGPVVRHKISAGEKLQEPRGTASAFKRDVSSIYVHSLASYGQYERLARYADYSEMMYVPEIASALDIVADEVTCEGEDGHVIKIQSKNDELKQILETLFFEIFDVDYKLWGIVRTLCKNGDYVMMVDASESNGILNLLPIPINEIEREEGYDKEDPFAVRFRWTTHGNVALQNWQMIHFRLLGDDQFLPYGVSYLEPARRIWRQLILIEDAMLVYRIVRSPERRVFKIDVGNLPPEDIDGHMEMIKNNLRRNQIVDNTTGRVDLRYNAMSVDEDLWIPKRGVNDGTQIDTLPGGQFTGDIEDVQYIQNKLFAALKIPKAYLGYESELGCLNPATRVPLLDGRILSLPEIRDELISGADLWAYSVDPETSQVVPGRIMVSSPTRANAEMVRVTLDDGESFDCTPDHKCLTREGIYIEAQFLTEGDRLMPLYRKISDGIGKTKKKKLQGYEMVYQPGSDTWEYTHKTVDKWKYLTKEKFTRRTIHHKDFNKLNNNPDNLIEMEWDDHRKLHQDILNENRHLWIAAGKYSGMNNGYSRKSYEKIKHLYDYDLLVEWCKTHKPKNRREIFKKYGLPEVWFGRLLSKVNVTYKDFASKNIVGGYKLARKNEGGYKISNYRRSGAMASIAKDLGLPTWFPKPCKTCSREMVVPIHLLDRKKFCSWSCRRPDIQLDGLNHTVKSVVHLEEKCDTWCITVDGHHNFAIEKGVIISNSKATLAQEDVRFAKTIERIQKLVIAELNKIAIIHLFLMGYDGEDLVDFEISMASPSTVATQQRLELWRMRLEIASMAGEGVLNKDTIYKDILGFNEAKIAKIKEGRRLDKLEDSLIEKVGTETETPEMAPDAAGAEPDLPGEEELPTTLGGSPENAGFDLHGQVLGEEDEIEEIRNPGSEGNDAFMATDKGKDLFNTGEDQFNLVFGTEKQTASDPFDQRARNRLITRPFSESPDDEDIFDEMFEEIEEAQKNADEEKE